MFLNKINNIFLCLGVIFIRFHIMISDFGSVDLDAVQWKLLWIHQLMLVVFSLM